MCDANRTNIEKKTLSKLNRLWGGAKLDLYHNY